LSPVAVLQRKLLSLLSCSCKSLHTERWFRLQSSFSRGGTKFAAFGHVFKYSFKMHCIIGPECYKHQPDCTVDRQSVCSRFLAQVWPFRDLCSTHSAVTEDFVKYFIKSQACFEG
jgi:hypothetical protein